MCRQLAIVLVLVAPALVFAVDANEPPKMPWKKSGFRIGAQTAAAESSMTLGINNVGINVNLEEALGLDTNTTTAYAWLYFRSSKNPRHRYDISWYSSRRESQKTLGQDITIGDTTFLQGTNITANYDMDIIKSSYSYSIVQDDRVDLALSAGLYVLPMRFAISASGSLEANESENITAPLPVFGFSGMVALTPKWIFYQRAQLFYLEYEGFNGGITDVGLGLEWRPLRNVGVGFDIQSLAMRVHAEGGDYPGVNFVGDVRFKTLGLMLYGSVFH